MSLNPSEDIRSVTDLKRNTKEILSQVHRTKRPVVLTVNGKADAVLMDTKTYEKHLMAANMARLLARAERDVDADHTRPSNLSSKTLNVPAKFRVRITRTAERDVEEAWAFITQDSPEEAEKFVSRLEEQIKLWSVFPNAVLSFPKTKHSVLAIDIDIRQLPQRISKSRKNGLHFARHPWRETPRQFDVRGLESDIAKAATGDAFMVSQLRKHGKTH